MRYFAMFAPFTRFTNLCHMDVSHQRLTPSNRLISYYWKISIRNKPQFIIKKTSSDTSRMISKTFFSCLSIRFQVVDFQKL